jgi:hypothetical protein
MRKMISLAALTTILFLPAAGNAQALADLRAGARARVFTIEGGKTVGTVTAISADSISLTDGRTDAVSPAISMTQVSRLQVSNGRNRGRGALMKGLIGLGAGAASGGLLAAATYSEEPSNGWCIIVCSRGEAAAFGAVAGGGVGLIIGALVGAATGWETWSNVKP